MDAEICRSMVALIVQLNKNYREGRRSIASDEKMAQIIG